MEKHRIIDVTPISVEIENKPKARKAHRLTPRVEKTKDLREQIDECITVGEMISKNVETLAIGFLASLLKRKR